ncbi:MAG: hypothetical protein Q9221_008863 [Calogaya cf. arnoldii]
MRKRSASALPWDPPTWESENSQTVAQRTYPSSEVGAVSSEDEEDTYDSANVTPPDSSSGEESDTLWVENGTPDTQHETHDHRHSVTTTISATQDDDKPSLQATKPVMPVSGAVRRDDRHPGPIIKDDAIISRSPSPKLHNDQTVRRDRTSTRQAAHARQQASYAQMQASYAQQQTWYPPMQASNVPRQASWAEIQVPYTQPRTSLSAMAGKVSGPRGFRAFIITDPMEEDVILNEFYSNTTNWDRADIRYGQPFWELENINCTTSVHPLRIPLYTEDYGLCERWIFTHETMMAIIADQKEDQFEVQKGHPPGWIKDSDEDERPRGWETPYLGAP